MLRLFNVLETKTRSISFQVNDTDPEQLEDRIKGIVRTMSGKRKDETLNVEVIPSYGKQGKSKGEGELVDAVPCTTIAAESEDELVVKLSRGDSGADRSPLGEDGDDHSDDVVIEIESTLVQHSWLPVISATLWAAAF